MPAQTSPRLTPPPVTVLSEPDWRRRQTAHEHRVDSWVTPYLRRRSAGASHPVEDFLFTYYSFSPGALRRWHPGVGVRLEGAPLSALGVRGYVEAQGQTVADPALPAARAPRVEQVLQLLVSIAARPPLLGCFGLHEWAMVYRQPQEELRHPAYPLRLGSRGTDEVVDQHRIACTHVDAFRFFASPARRLNAVQPSHETALLHEQPGCLHTTMDCYREAYQLAPFASADLVADCFELARDVRLVDMRASPYDLSTLGVDPIRIETAAGKREYVAAQRLFASRAVPLRARLIETCRRTLAYAEQTT